MDAMGSAHPDPDVLVAIVTTALLDLHAVSGTVSRIAAGTETDNFAVHADDGRRLFAKVYRDHNALDEDRAAIALSQFAAAGGVPVPTAHRSRSGDVIGTSHGVSLSLWDLVADARTAEDGIRGERWVHVGRTLGMLHRRLAEHPAADPQRRPASGVADVVRARGRYDRLIEEHRGRAARDADAAWALEAMTTRRSLLPRIVEVLASLPPMTVQVLHGDLAAPNLLMCGDEVAAVIDFQPPAPHYLEWEIARIGCDPRTVLEVGDWPEGLARLRSAYLEEHHPPSMPSLRSIIAAGCAFTMASAYPLAALLEEQVHDSALREYGRQRHEAALRLLDALDDLP
ncbi:phosphotransferase enzyme family protein [Brachybacterium hainanense]|uniref:Phosphotransferase enzyme family protein n=1 Tax=Brachybacterium hainanense TaxID=1541174 RepID=A0ABV6RF85_9MICO